MGAFLTGSTDPNFVVEINNDEGFGIEISMDQAERIFNRLGEIIGTIPVWTIEDLQNALNDLYHLRKFRDNLQAENARVALKNQKLMELVNRALAVSEELEVRSLLTEAKSL